MRHEGAGRVGAGREGAGRDGAWRDGAWYMSGLGTDLDKPWEASLNFPGS